jgi:membrane protease YdiL (CAAX protease family)
LRLKQFGDRPWVRLALALLISQGLFALSHIPNRIYLGMKPNEIAVDLLMLLGWGTLYTIVYLRTDNLFIVVGIHALGNTPTTLFRTAPILSGDGASILIYTLVMLYLFGLPLLRARREKVRLHLAPDS